MISTSAILFSTASRMISSRLRSMSRPLLKISCRSSVSLAMLIIKNLFQRQFFFRTQDIDRRQNFVLGIRRELAALQAFGHDLKGELLRRGLDQIAVRQ